MSFCGSRRPVLRCFVALGDRRSLRMSNNAAELPRREIQARGPVLLSGPVLLYRVLLLQSCIWLPTWAPLVLRLLLWRRQELASVWLIPAHRDDSEPTAMFRLIIN